MFSKILNIFLVFLFVFSAVPSAFAEETGGNQVEDSNQNFVWQSVTFGQSTDLNFAANVLPGKIGTNYAAPKNPGTIDGEITVESRGGKLAPGHDGLTFYYTKL